MLVTDNGILMTCGSGDHGVQGHKDTSDCLKPKLVEDLLNYDVMQVYTYVYMHYTSLQCRKQGH